MDNIFSMQCLYQRVLWFLLCSCENGACRSEDGLCSNCSGGFFGPNCENACVCINGECDDGILGDGTCSCSPDYFGINCQNSYSCVNGECDDGILGDGSCSCSPGCYGESCDIEYICEYGECDEMGSCVCHSGYTGESCGLCEYEERCFPSEEGEVCVCSEERCSSCGDDEERVISVPTNINIDSQLVNLTSLSVNSLGEGSFSNSQLILSNSYITFSSNLTFRESDLTFESDSVFQVGGCLILEEVEGEIRLREEEVESESDDEEISISIVEYNCLEGEFDSFVIEREESGSGSGRELHSICGESIEYGTKSMQLIFSIDCSPSEQNLGIIMNRLNFFLILIFWITK